MKKGYLGLAMENIYSFVIILLAIVIMLIGMKLASDKGTSKLEDNKDNYEAMRDLHQLLNTKTNYLGYEYRFVDLLATYPYDENVRSPALNVLQEFYPTEIVDIDRGHLITRLSPRSGEKIDQDFIVLQVGNKAYWDTQQDSSRFIADFKQEQKKLLIPELSKEVTIKMNEKYDGGRISVKHITSITGERYAIVLLRGK